MARLIGGLRVLSFYFTLAIGIALGVDSTAADWSSGRSWSARDTSSFPTRGTSSSGSSAMSLFKGREKISPFSPDSHNISLSVGQVFLMGDLGKGYSDNIGGRLGYTYGVSDIFGFSSSIGYSSHSDGDFSMTTLLAGLRTNLAWFDRIVPHAIFGLGFYKPSYSLGVAAADQVSPVLFGLHLGPGVDLQLNESIFFGTGLTFHSIFGAEKSTASGKKVEAGGTFTSFLLHAGVTL